MAVMPPFLRHPGARTKQDARREDDARRGSAQSRGYDSRWAKASRGFRKAHPFCEYCLLRGEYTTTSLVDHLYPHRRFENVFWERKWWVAACAACHNGFKQAIELQGRAALDDLARKLGRPPMG